MAVPQRSLAAVLLTLIVLWACSAVTAADDPPAPTAPPMPAAATVGDVPAAPPEAAETLEAAWQMALQGDQRLEASQWNLSAANRSLAAAQAERLPSVNLGANYYALSDQPQMALNLPPLPFAMPSHLPLMDRESAGIQAVVSQPLYTFGRITHGIDAAHQAVHAQQSDVQRTALDVKMNVAEIYVTVLRTARLQDVAESKVVSLTAHTKRVASFYDNGSVSKNDLLAAQVALADARQQVVQVQNQRQVAWAAYNRALGRALTQPVQLAELADDGAAGDVEELTQRAWRSRPELAGLAAQAAALREQAASVQAKRAPQLALRGGYLFQENQYVDPNGIAGVAVVGEWNVLDCGRTGNQAAALCEKAQAVTRLAQDAQSLIALEVRQRYLELQTARQRVEVARQTTAQADENLRVAKSRYEKQVGTNTEVLDAETLRLQAYTNLYNSSYEVVLAGLRLRRAVGDL